jgi:hypothetical protein
MPSSSSKANYSDLVVRDEAGVLLEGRTCPGCPSSTSVEALPQALAFDHVHQQAMPGLQRAATRGVLVAEYLRPSDSVEPHWQALEPPVSSQGLNQSSLALHGKELRGRLADGDDVERRDRSLEPFERELPDRLHFDLVFDLRVEALRDKDLAGGRLIGQA